MPIYMDRHDGVDATPEELAEAHLKDLKIQHLHGCKLFTYWLDQERGTVFCLVEAPNAEAVHRLHQDAHGYVPNKVIEVHPTAVQNFLGRIEDPDGDVSPDNPIDEPAFRALLATDMVNSTDIVNTLGDVAALSVFHRHREIILDSLSTYSGREVDRAGDGFLTTFSSASNAVACAVSIQKDLDDYNTREESDVPIQIRIGLGAGEPVADGNALFGSAVNLTARICSKAGPSEILSSSVIRQLCVGKRFVFKAYGAVSLKGFPEPVPLDSVIWKS